MYASIPPWYLTDGAMVNAHRDNFALLFCFVLHCFCSSASVKFFRDFGFSQRRVSRFLTSKLQAVRGWYVFTRVHGAQTTVYFCTLSHIYLFLIRVVRPLIKFSRVLIRPPPSLVITTLYYNDYF